MAPAPGVFGCTCLVASEGSAVVGTLDLYTPRKGRAAQGAPEGDLQSAYVSNVCVPVEQRRRGVATLLMKAAADVARGLGLRSVYVHVDADNEQALALYGKLGLEETGEFSPGIGASTIGRRHLLRWAL